LRKHDEDFRIRFMTRLVKQIMESSKKDALGEVLIQAQQSRILGATESLWIASVKKLSRKLSKEMIISEKDRAVNILMTLASVRMRKIVEKKDEIMSRLLKDLF
jgi:hypothetical protein